jgi:hypothetical protein
MKVKPAVAKKLPIDSCQTSRLALYLSDVECDGGISNGMGRNSLLNAVRRWQAGKR